MVNHLDHLIENHSKTLQSQPGLSATEADILDKVVSDHTAQFNFTDRQIKKDVKRQMKIYVTNNKKLRQHYHLVFKSTVVIFKIRNEMGMALKRIAEHFTK